jgi:hypothetical protein
MNWKIRLFVLVTGLVNFLMIRAMIYSLMGTRDLLPPTGWLSNSGLIVTFLVFGLFFNNQALAIYRELKTKRLIERTRSEA